MNGTTSNTALATIPQSGPGIVKAEVREEFSIRFTPEQEDLIRATCCGGASKSEADALISIAEARGLNPILGECYFVQREGKWAVQASIDSFRIKAEDTGLYDGQDEPEFEYDAKGNLALARVRVWRRDWKRPSVGVARFEEYAQTKTGGELTRFWKKMPHNQLAKCAEALAMRKAFPKRFAKIYATEEMQQADVIDAEVEPPAPPSSRPTETADVAYRRISDMIDRAESSNDFGPIVTETRKAAKAKVISKEQFEQLNALFAPKKEIIVKMEGASAPAADTVAILKDFERRVAELVKRRAPLAEVRKLGAEVSRSPLDEQQRNHLDNVFATAEEALHFDPDDMPDPDPFNGVDAEDMADLVGDVGDK